MVGCGNETSPSSAQSVYIQALKSACIPLAK